MGLEFKISAVEYLSIKDKNALIEAYRMYFADCYGKDMVDSFLNVSNLKSNESRKRDILKDYSDNYKNAIEVFENLISNSYYELLCIKKDNILIGAGRLYSLNRDECGIKEIVFIEDDKKITREVWKQTVSFVEKYFKEKHYKKMYIEIPYLEGPLLIRADELGFKEDPNDIIVGKKEYTYLLNKELERNKDE